MSEFKIGMRVKEISTGDVGYITKNYDEDSWWVQWEDDKFCDQVFWVNESEIVIHQESTLPDTLTIDGVTYQRVV